MPASRAHCRRAQQPPRPLAGRLAVAEGFDAGDEGVVVALGALQHALAAGRQVVDDLRAAHAQAIEVDDVDVGPQAGREQAAVGEAVGRAVSRVCFLTSRSSARPGPRLRSRAQCVSSVVGELASQIRPTWAPPSDRPQTVASSSSISRTTSRLPAA